VALNEKVNRLTEPKSFQNQNLIFIIDRCGPQGVLRWNRLLQSPRTRRNKPAESPLGRPGEQSAVSESDHFNAPSEASLARNGRISQRRRRVSWFRRGQVGF